MKKIIELCGILCAGIIYLGCTTWLHVNILEVTSIVRITCIMVRILLSVGGIILIFNNIKTKINNKANYLAVSIFEMSILLIGELICYLLMPYEQLGMRYETYKLVFEWFQIGILLMTIKCVSEHFNMKKVIIVQWVVNCLFFLAAFSQLQGLNIISKVLDNSFTRMITAIGILILWFMNKEKIDQMASPQNEIFARLFICKIIIQIVVFMRLNTGLWVFELMECMMQVFFSIGIVAFIDEVTIGNTWLQVERCVVLKQKEVVDGQGEKKILECAVERVQSIIEEEDRALFNLERLLGVGGKGKEYIQKIKNNSYRLSKLSGHILELDALNYDVLAPDFKRMDMNHLVRELIESLEPYVEHQSIILKYHALENEIMVDVNPDAIERILINLISNAIKYNQKNGMVQVSLSQKDENVYLCVQDSGIGMSAQGIKKIFNKYTREQNEKNQYREGSGLGMAIVKSLVDMHNGQIKVESGEGKGTLVSITFPKEQLRSKWHMNG